MCNNSEQFLSIKVLTQEQVVVPCVSGDHGHAVSVLLPRTSSLQSRD